MYRVIISGANSFIGLELAKQLSDRGNKVYALARINASGILNLRTLSNVEVVQYSLDRITNACDEIKEPCDTFIHLAWEGIRGQARDDKEVQGRNRKWTQKAFEAAKAAGCKTFIMAGSQAEYGPGNGKRMDESFLCSPVTQYGIQKLKAYEYLMNVAPNYGIRIIEPRFFSVYGPFDSPNALVPSLIHKMAKNEDCHLTKGEQRWDYLYISDAANAVTKLIENEICRGTYNVAWGADMTLKDYVEEMKAALGSESRLLFGAVPYSSDGKMDLMADVNRLKKDTGWKPQTEFKKGIILTKEFLERESIK